MSITFTLKQSSQVEGLGDTPKEAKCTTTSQPDKSSGVRSSISLLTHKGSLVIFILGFDSAVLRKAITLCPAAKAKLRK